MLRSLRPTAVAVHGRPWLRRLASLGQSEDVWPDGTPKKFKGREAWKNWIDWDSPHRSQTDELNRARHYFWEVDDRGRLWRQELDAPGQRFGQMKDSRILDFFFGHMQANRTGLYGDEYPFISFRMHEHYFTRCATAPIVFNDLRDGELRHICPDGDIARSVTTAFDPALLRVAEDGRLFHAVRTKAVDADGAPRSELLLALLESTTAQQLLESCDDAGDAHPPGTVRLRWEGVESIIERLS